MDSFKVIAKEQERLIDLYPKVEALLKKFPHVLDVGVGVKETAGKLTEELCFRVYVSKKHKPKELSPSDLLPQSILGVKIDVLEKHPFTLNSFPDRTKYPSLRGGIQIRNKYFSGNNSIGAGTIGCLARTTPGNKLVGLTARHVLTDGNTGNPLPAVTTIQIGHPRWIKCCCCTYNEVGSVLQVSSITSLDCGIFELDADAISKVATEGTEELVHGVGLIQGVAQAVCYERVRKRGSATGVTFGVIVDVLYEGSNILINPCTEFTNFTQPGDSGAVIVNSDNKVVGLLIGSSRTDATKGVAHHIKPVLTELSIKIADQGASTAGLLSSPVACAPGGTTTLSSTLAASAAFFRELDDSTLYIYKQRQWTRDGGASGSGPFTTRYVDFDTHVVPILRNRMFSDSNGWVQRAKINQISDALTVTEVSNPDLFNAIKRLSALQLNLLKAHFPGTVTGTMDIDMVRKTFERFMNGELRERPSGVHPYGPGELLVDGPREPNGSFEIMFSGFAWFCIENNIDAAEWTPIYNILVQCQEMFMFVYRRRPQSPPPSGSLPIPTFTPGAAGNSLEPITQTIGAPGFGDQGYTFTHFNLTSTTSSTQMLLDVASVTSPAQSNEARKVVLRAKYALLDYPATKIAMKENIQRMLYMP